MDRERKKGARGPGAGLLLGLGLALAPWALPFCPSVLAQTSEEPRVTYQAGTVTAVRGDSVGINGKDYKLTPDATITDDLDKPRSSDSIKVDREVKFHLNRLGQIDRLIVVVPR